MTFASELLARGDLVAYWPLTDAAGATTAVDLGPNTLTGTYDVAKVDGITLVGGLGACMQGDGTTQRMSRAVPGGSPLRLTTAFTLGAWVQLKAWPASGTVGIMGRGGNYYTRVSNVGQIQGTANVASPSASTSLVAASQFSLAVAEPFFVATSWDATTGELMHYINGWRVSVQTILGGSIAASSDAFEALSLGNSTKLNAHVGHVFVTNTAMGGDDVRSLYESNPSNVIPAQGVDWDYRSDSDATIAASAPSGRCAVDGGKMRAAESSVTHGSKKYHPGCYVARRSHLPALVIDAASTQPDIVTSAMRTMYDWLEFAARNHSPSKIQRFNGTRWVGYDNVVINEESDGHMLGVVGVLHRMGGLDKNNWLLDLGTAAIQAGIDNQDALGNIEATNIGLQFVNGLATGLLLLQDVLDRETYQAGVRSMVRFGNYLITQPQPTTESEYYINGNYELAELYFYWQLYRLTGHEKWNTQYETQYEWCIDPTPNTDSAGLPGYGLTYVTTPTLPDGRDGKGYLGESQNNGLAGPNGVAGPGYDGDYTQFQLSIVTRLWMLNGDPRILRLANLFHNQLMDDVNTSTWVLDATGGSRHSLSLTFTSASLPTLAWRTDRSISDADVANHFVAVRNTYFGNRYTNNIGYYRGVNLDVAGWVIGSDQWPGLLS